MSSAVQFTLLLLPAVALAGLPPATNPGDGTCGVIGTPTKCLPREQNVIFDPLPPATFTASSECNGDRYCIRSNPVDINSMVVCATCPAPSGDHNNPVGFGRANLYNLNEDFLPFEQIGTTTRWQSGLLTTLSDNVVLQANMALPFVIDSITFLFYSVKPRSLFVEKSVDFGQTFTPFVYFSDDCLNKYGIAPQFSAGAVAPSFPNNVAQVECVPIEGGNTVNSLRSSIQYRFQQNRVSNSFSASQTEIDIETTPALEEYLTATNIRITLDDAQYPEGIVGNSSWNYYAAYDLNIRGGCQCHGHANMECRPNGNCSCAHRTTGVNCERCLPGFVDVPWRKSLLQNPFECQGKVL